MNRQQISLSARPFVSERGGAHSELPKQFAECVITLSEFPRIDALSAERSPNPDRPTDRRNFQ